jgi:hypothetical protein
MWFNVFMNEIPDWVNADIGFRLSHLYSNMNPQYKEKALHHLLDGKVIVFEYSDPSHGVFKAENSPTAVPDMRPTLDAESDLAFQKFHNARFCIAIELHRDSKGVVVHNGQLDCYVIDTRDNFYNEGKKSPCDPVKAVKSTSLGIAEVKEHGPYLNTLNQDPGTPGWDILMKSWDIAATNRFVEIVKFSPDVYLADNIPHVFQVRRETFAQSIINDLSLTNDTSPDRSGGNSKMSFFESVASCNVRGAINALKEGLSNALSSALAAMKCGDKNRE